MNNVLRRIRANEFINKPIRIVLRKASKYIQALEYVKKRWPVSGVVLLQVEDIRFKAYTMCDDHIINNLYYDSTYENSGIKIISILSKKCDVILDIGANTGLYSLITSKVNPSVKIISFEPHPHNYSRLNKNIQINQIQNIIPIQSAVGSYVGRINFYIPQDNSISDISSTSKDFSESIYNIQFKEISVNLTSIDNFLNSMQINRVELIKVDVEGFEYEVFKGAFKTIQKYKPIILGEVFSAFCPDENDFIINYPKVYDLQRLLAELQYHIYEIQEQELNYIPSFNFLHKNRNYIFSHKKILDKKITLDETLLELL